MHGLSYSEGTSFLVVIVKLKGNQVDGLSLFQGALFPKGKPPRVGIVDLTFVDGPKTWMGKTVQTWMGKFATFGGRLGNHHLFGSPKRHSHMIEPVIELLQPNQHPTQFESQNNLLSSLPGWAQNVSTDCLPLNWASPKA